jgi:hypothetical protein
MPLARDFKSGNNQSFGGTRRGRGAGGATPASVSLLPVVEERNYEYLLMYTGRLGGRARGEGDEPPDHHSSDQIGGGAKCFT